MAWGVRGVRALQLPEGVDEDGVRENLCARTGADPAEGEPPAVIARAVQRVQAYLGGGLGPLRGIPIDLEGATPFKRRIYEALRSVPPGRTTTYAALAVAAGRPGAARAVGQVMAQNPLPLLVPCHRVLGAAGELGGFSAWGGERTKLRLLTLEGADLRGVARAGAHRIARQDPALVALIRRVGPYRLCDEQRGDPFTALAEAIVHQQVSMKAGAAIFGRLRRLAGGRAILAPRRVLACTASELRAAGLSARKAEYLHDLAGKCTDGTLSLRRLARLDDEQVIQSLIQVKGIGRWSAEMFLMFSLGRLDVLPVDDLGLRKGAQRLYGGAALPGASELRSLAERWAPFRSIATWYLWRSLDSGGL